MANEPIKPGEADFRFLSLLMSLTTAAWSQLGKVAHPVTQKIERDIEQAQITIEFIRMLRDKTKGNLTPKEEELLMHTLSDLELNYVDEAKKGDDATTKGPDIIIPAGVGKGPEILKP